MPAPSAKTKSEPVVCVQDLTVAYGDHVAVDDISFDVKRGSAVAIIGPNGSGKTSVIRSILGLQPIKKGKVRIFGSPVEASRGRVGYVPQRFNFDPTFPLTVREFMHLSHTGRGSHERIQNKIKEVGLTPAILDAHLGRLSGGELQRVLVAQAILDDPELLILDEPATGIDIVGEATFYDAVLHLKEEHDTTVLLVSHDLAVVSKLVDQVICLNRKLMCSGPPSTALTEKMLAEVFGQNATFYQHRGHGKTTHGHHQHE